MFKCNSCGELTAVIRDLNAQLLSERESYERLRADCERQVGSLLDRLLAVGQPSALAALKAEPKRREPAPPVEKNPLPPVPASMSADLLFAALNRSGAKPPTES